MDPFSITVGCIGLCESITKTSCGIASLIRTVRAARNELNHLNQQLEHLRLILVPIQQDIGPQNNVPEPRRDMIFSIINECLDTLSRINSVTKEYSGSWGPGRWAVKGKDKVRAESECLKGSIEKLELILQGYYGAMIKDIREQSNSSIEYDKIHEGISGIQGDTAILRMQSSDQTSSLDLIHEKVSRIECDISKLFKDYSRDLEKTTNQLCIGVEHRPETSIRADGGDTWVPRDTDHFPTDSDEYQLSISTSNDSVYTGKPFTINTPDQWQVINGSPLIETTFSSQGETYDCFRTSVITDRSNISGSNENPIAAQFKKNVLAKANPGKTDITETKVDICESKKGRFSVQSWLLADSFVPERAAFVPGRSLSPVASPEPRTADQQVLINNFQRVVRERIASS